MTGEPEVQLESNTVPFVGSPGFQITPVYWMTAVSPALISAPSPSLRFATRSAVGGVSSGRVMPGRPSGPSTTAGSPLPITWFVPFARARYASRMSTTATTESLAERAAGRFAAGIACDGGRTTASRSPTRAQTSALRSPVICTVPMTNFAGAEPV